MTMMLGTMSKLDNVLPSIVIPYNYNYIAVFLTFSCQLRCTYCINHHGGNLLKKRWMSGDSWIKGLNRIITRNDLPITIQGGEPTAHKHIVKIIRGLREDISVDILTNFEDDKWLYEIAPGRFVRPSKYASIRVSYHHGQSCLTDLLERVLRASEKGYPVGIWEVDHPAYHGEVLVRQQQAISMGIDYRLKEFLGPYEGENYGTMRYPRAVNDYWLRSCECKTSELLIDPLGDIYRCHSDLYAGRGPIGNLLDPGFNAEELDKWRSCSVMGKCNSCDVKIKTNRFQEYGHSSVEIRNISRPYARNTEHQYNVTNTYGKSDKISVQ
jgi:hypothetical protein